MVQLAIETLSVSLRGVRLGLAGVLLGRRSEAGMEQKSWSKLEKFKYLREKFIS